jgi:hypothetical protein
VGKRGRTLRNDSRKRFTSSRLQQSQNPIQSSTDDESSDEESDSAQDVVERKRQKVAKSWEVSTNNIKLSDGVKRFLLQLATIMKSDNLHSLDSLIASLSSSHPFPSFSSNSFDGFTLFNKCVFLQKSIDQHGFILMKTQVELAIWFAR